MKSDLVLFVSAGLLEPKKNDDALARKHRYLNYGVLGLASILAEKGYNPIVTDGCFNSPDSYRAYLEEKRFFSSNFPMFLSIPSFYSVPWSKVFCKSVKSAFPDKKIIVGGRWVAGRDGKWLSANLPEADIVVCGMAEDRVEDLLYAEKWSHIPHTNISRTTCPNPENVFTLNYSILDNFTDYNPSIEISRGCGMGCFYCAERSYPRSKMKTANSTIESIQSICEMYNQTQLNFYFESSYFKPTIQWAMALYKKYKDSDVTSQWRMETRVEGLSLKTLRVLAGCGLRVIDLGLESASSVQLLKMGKTTNPDQYLQKASALLRACYDLGVWVKVNILLYPGETTATLNETRSWLDAHRGFIKGASVSPLVIFNEENAHLLLDAAKGFGAHEVNLESLQKEGICRLHLSEEVCYEESVGLSMEISRDIMSARDYFDLKAFSYFPRDFRYEDFKRIARDIDYSDKFFS